MAVAYPGPGLPLLETSKNTWKWRCGRQTFFLLGCFFLEERCFMVGLCRVAFRSRSKEIDRLDSKWGCTPTKRKISSPAGPLDSSLPCNLQTSRIIRSLKLISTVPTSAFPQSHMDVSKNSGFSPQIIPYFNRVFQPWFSPSILGVLKSPIFWLETAI